MITEIIIAFFSLVLGGGTVGAIVNRRSQKELKEMELGAVERKSIREDIDKLQRQYSELHGKYEELHKKYLDTLTEHRMLKSDYDIQKKELERLNKRINIYKDQEGKLTRINRALNAYYQNSDVSKLISILETELLK